MRLFFLKKKSFFHFLSTTRCRLHNNPPANQLLAKAAALLHESSLSLSLSFLWQKGNGGITSSSLVSSIEDFILSRKHK
jgi:hypothetical protein